MDKDITEYFVSLIESSGAIDVAEAEFKRIVADDNDLRELYRQWCADMGTIHYRLNGILQTALCFHGHTKIRTGHIC